MSPKSLSTTLAAALLALAANAVAQETGTAPTANAQPAPAAETKPAPVEAPKTDPAVEAALKAAKDAADAARMAAEAAKASTDALREALKPKEEPKAAAAPPSPWKFTFGLAGVAVSGNANAMTASANAKATGSFEGWAVAINGGAAYGQTTTANVTAAEVTAMNALLDGRGDLKLGDTFGLFLKAGTMTDRVAKIEAQLFGEIGASVKFFELKEPDFTRAKLNTDLGFRYTRENRAEFFPVPADLEDINILAPRLNAEFLYAINKTSIFTAGVEVLPDIINLANLRVAAYARLAAQLMDGVALTVGFKLRYIGAPAAGAQTTDTETLVGITWTM